MNEKYFASYYNYVVTLEFQKFNKLILQAIHK